MWHDSLDLRPIWTVEPSLELIISRIIAHRHLKLSQNEIAHTTVNSSFKVVSTSCIQLNVHEDCTSCAFLYLLTQTPITSSEIATIAVLRSHTSVPVPHVIASGSSSDNGLRFEWILMERVHGIPLADVWASLPGCLALTTSGASWRSLDD